MKRLLLIFMLLLAGCQKIDEPDLLEIDNKDYLELTLPYGGSFDFTPEAMTIHAPEMNEIRYNTIDFMQLGEQKIIYTYKDQMLEVDVHIVDADAPVIEGTIEMTISWNQIDSLDYMRDLTAYDNLDGDLTDKITCEALKVEGNQGTQVCKVSDLSGNVAQVTLSITLMEEEGPIIVYSNGIINGLAITPNMISNPDSIIAMVNKLNALPDDYAPSDLIKVEGEYLLREEAALQYQSMREAAYNDGINLIVLSAYRTKDYQSNLFYNYLNQNGEEFAATYSAVPRRSEHEMGLAVDIGDDYYLDAELNEKDTGKWLVAHAHEYGYILRYPEDKVLITQYGFEAWHYRYVGVELATYLKENNLTLEEYYEFEPADDGNSYRFQ